MAVPRCDLTKLTGRAIAALNAAPASTWATTISASDDNRRNTTEIQNAILGADMERVRALCLEGEYRSLFLVQTTFTHGAKVEHLGPIEAVLIQPYSGAEWITGLRGKADDIDSMRVNTENIYDTVAHDQQGSSLAGQWDLLGDEFHFTGFAAKGLVANPQQSGACQSPDIYEDDVLQLALRNLVKEGDTAPFLRAA